MIKNFEKIIRFCKDNDNSKFGKFVRYYAGNGESEWIIADADVNAKNKKSALIQMMRKLGLSLDEDNVEMFLNDEFGYASDIEEGRYVEEQKTKYDFYICVMYPKYWTD